MEASNVKAMREALLKAIILLKACEWPDDAPMKAVAEVIDEIEKASFAPPRNCDSGTAREQYARFNKYCNARHKNDKPNPCGIAHRASNPCAKCYSMWAQMPYEADAGSKEGGAE